MKFTPFNLEKKVKRKIGFEQKIFKIFAKIKSFQKGCFLLQYTRYCVRIDFDSTRYSYSGTIQDTIYCVVENISPLSNNS